MKTERLALHKTFEKDSTGKRQLVVHVSDGTDHLMLPPKKFLTFLAKLPPTTTIRATAVHATDAVLLDLAERGNPIEYAYWHATGLAKGLDPADLVAQYALLPAEIFRSFKPRRDIAELKQVLGLRNAIVQFYGDATRRLKQTGRDVGDPEMEIAVEELNSIRKGIVLEEGTSLDKHVERLAKKIPECVLFKDTACIADSWIMAASFVAFSGGVDRFPTVAALNKYCGEHVTPEGTAPKRRKGQNVDWNPRLRTVLYQLSSTIIKNRTNPWRLFYEDARAAEMAVHDQKHPGCKTKEGHCTMRAMRKMVKEIIKRFYLAANGIQFIDGHNPLAQSHDENQTRFSEQNDQKRAATGELKPIQVLLPAKVRG
jgi:hypothetical protein